MPQCIYLEARLRSCKPCALTQTQRCMRDPCGSPGAIGVQHEVLSATGHVCAARVQARLYVEAELAERFGDGARLRVQAGAALERTKGALLGTSEMTLTPDVRPLVVQVQAEGSEGGKSREEPQKVGVRRGV